MTDQFKQIGDQKRLTMMIWGEHDVITPHKNHKLLQEIIPEVEFLSVSKAKHAVHIEKFELVNENLLAFLNK